MSADPWDDDAPASSLPEWVETARALGDYVPPCCEAPDDEPSGPHYQRFVSPYSVPYAEVDAEIRRERDRCIERGDYSRRTGRRVTLGRMHERKVDGWLECRASCAADRAITTGVGDPEDEVRHVLNRRALYVPEAHHCAGAAPNPLPVAVVAGAIAFIKWAGSLVGTALAYYAASEAAAELGEGADDADVPSSLTAGVYVDDARTAIADARAQLSTEGGVLARLALSMAARLESQLSSCSPVDFLGAYIGAYRCFPAVNSEALRVATVVLRKHTAAALGGPTPAVRVPGVDYGPGVPPVRATGSMSTLLAVAGVAALVWWVMR